MVYKHNSNIECPDDDALSSLINGKLNGDRELNVTNHVGSCTSCQSHMESIATNGDNKFSDIVRHIDKVDPPHDSAYWQALQQAESALTAAYPTEGPPPDLKLEFLQPSDKPGYLGTIGSFEVIRVLGRGGMGVVLHAIDPMLSRDVAIKILDPQLANNELARQRFCREARAAAAVTHENLVAVHQVNEDSRSGLPFLVMQLVNGESLEQRIRRQGRLSPNEVAHIGLQAARGLASAHAQGLIHRDIKPGNILIEDGTNKVRLTDFGLARATEDLKLTKTGFVAGTPLYMAPEQARGDDIDARADLFSLGSVLYEALAGKPPFEGKTPLAVLRRVADEPHARLKRVNRDVPEWLEDVIDTLLSKDPNDRYQTADQVVELLAQHSVCLSPHSPLQVAAAGCTSGSAPLSRRARKKFCIRTAVALLTTFAIGAVAGAAGLWQFIDHSSPNSLIPSPPRPEMTEPAATVPPLRVLQARSGAVWSVAFSPDGTSLAMGVENGRVGLWDSTSGRLKFDLHPERNEQAPAHRGPVWAVNFTEDGKTLITVSDDGTIKLWDALTGKQLYSIPVDTSLSAAAISDDGKWVVTGDRFGIVRVFDLTDQKLIIEYSQEATVNGVAFSPDNLTVASVATDGSVLLWEIPTNRKRANLVGHTGPVYSVNFSRDGERLVTSSWDSTVMIWDVNSGSLTTRINSHDEGVWAVQFSPCGGLLASAGQEGRTKLWDAVTGKMIAEYGGHKGTVHSLRFSRDGSHLATGGRDGKIRIWAIECD